MFQQQKSARKIALQALFQTDMQGPDFLADILPQFIAGATEDVDVRELSTSMVLGAWGYHETADQWLTQFSPRWTISRELATLLQGKIELVSALGKGATFSLVVPVTTAAASQV